MGRLVLAKDYFAGRQCGDEGVLLIRQHCPLDRVVRKNHVGQNIIGYNHVLDEASIPWKEITPENAYALLLMDLGVIAAAICQVIEVPLPQHQFDALCSFVHDFGIKSLTWFKGVQMLNDRGDYLNLPKELEKWHVSDAGVLRDPVRTARRHAECQMWMGIYTQTHGNGVDSPVCRA